MAIKTYNDQNFVAIANAIRSKSKNPTTYKPSEMAAAISAIESALEILPQDTVSGAIANFPDGSNNYPVVELIANIDYKQEGSTEVKVSKQGKNLCKNDLVNETVSGVNITINSDGAITLNGTATARFTRNLCANFTLKAGSYTLSCGTSALPISCYLNMNGGGQSISCTANVASKVVTYQEDTNINYIRIDIANGSILNNLTLYPMLEAGSTATAYEPYSAPEVKTISWESEAGTVYGGTLNVTTGELTSTLDSSGDPLPTPEVYQLEPEEVKTLLGVNNIYADTGNVSVTYRADVDLYIAKKIAEGA